LKELRFSVETHDYEGVLVHTPDGWDTESVSYGRLETYYGIGRSCTHPLRFVFEGGTILRDEFYTYKEKAYAYVYVDKLNKITNKYFRAYNAKVDYATFKDQDYYVEAALKDLGLADIIHEKEDEEISFYDSLGNCKLSFVDARYYEHITGGGHDYYKEYPFTGFWIMDVVKYMLDQMSAGGVTLGLYDVQSQYLDTFEDKILISTGTGWRCPGTDGTISFKDLFQALDTEFCIGARIVSVGSQEIFYIDPRTDVFDLTTEILDVGDVSKIDVEVDAKLVFSTVKVGYKNQGYLETVTAKKEMNCSSTFKTSPNTLSSREYPLISPIRADWQGCEEVRLSSGSLGGDLIFNQVVWANYWDNVMLEYRDGWIVEMGSLEKYPVATPPEVYPVSNTLITPRRMLLRNLWYLSDCQLDDILYTLTFTVGDNDQKHNRVFEPSEVGYVNEFDPVNLIARSKFYPITVQFEAPYPADTINILNSSNIGYIKFSYLGNSFKGFVKKFDVKLAGVASATYTLLLTKDNDLTLLMR
jgi:hypothetical protein